MHLGEPGAARLVERGGAHLLEQLLDHAADPHHLGRLLDHLGRVAALVRAAGDTHPLGADHDHGLLGVLRVTLRLLRLLLAHRPILTPARRGHTTRRSLPTCEDSSIVRCAAARVGEREPLVHDGADGAVGHQRPDQLAHLPHDRRLLGRRPGAQRRRHHGDPLAQHRAEVDLGLGAALQADHDEPAAGGEHVDVAGQVLRAHVVEHDVGAAAVGGLADPLDEVLARGSSPAPPRRARRSARACRPSRR